MKLIIAISIAVTLVTGCSSSNARILTMWKGYPCYGNCTQNKIGYAFAKQHKIKTRMHCPKTNAGVIEGCYSYIEGK